MRRVLKRINLRNKRSKLAVSEIMGTMLLLSIATTSFSGVSYYVLSYPAPTPAPLVDLSGMIDDNQVIVTHRGGESLELDTELSLNIGESLINYKVEDFLDDEAKEDGVWSLGEKFVYPLGYDFDYLAYPDIKINVVDTVSNSIVLNGMTIVNPICDLGIELTADNLYPKEHEKIEFSLTITNYGNVNASGALVGFSLPEGLTYISSTPELGTYHRSAGIWDISQIPKGESAVLEIVAFVDEFCYSDPTQLVFILDGSASISPESWEIALEGLSNVIGNNVSTPYNGAVELTIIQFGGWKPAFARLEIGPIIITESNAGKIVEDIRNIVQIGFKTPTSCGVYLAADTLYSSSKFGPSAKQIVFIVTDGNPTHCCDISSYIDEGCSDANGPKYDTVDARNYIIDLLEMTPGDDEFSVFSVDPVVDSRLKKGEITHVQWLKQYVVWPEPSYYAPPYIQDSDNGWLRNVSTWSDLEFAINATFQILFKSFHINVFLKATDYFDPRSINDVSDIKIEPYKDIDD